ncbi:hypothetical protein EGW08_008124 [Elysia chlorotica]|uniref:PWWP domain-containing protein n=1 Tax=Elysia chlorotica TaxID=188477 RepID=A0A3S0ZVN7_ELYCH|nr:hypothetical protein EGW08_008124 [Elysia chlorotica]
MANPNIENETLVKGVRLTVIVEYSFENLIAVFLFHNGKEFRGVLLENDTGLFPSGLPFSNKPMVEQNASVKASPRSALDVKPGTENKPPEFSYSNKEVKVEQSATCGRFSYSTNPFLVNPRPVPPIPTVEMRPVGPLRKTVRDIRLRPRQTLCSKCKSSIHESLKGNSSSEDQKCHSSDSKSSRTLLTEKKSYKVKSSATSHTNSVSHDTQRKRRGSNQTPMVLLEDIKHKYMKTSEKKGSKVSSSGAKNTKSELGAGKNLGRNNCKDLYKPDQKPMNSRTRSIRSSSVGNTISCSVQNSNVHDWLEEIDQASDLKLSVVQVNKHLKKDKNFANEKNSKPSPAIKISIGDGAVLKIPPRLPAEEAKFSEQQNWPQVADLTNCSNILNPVQHKKSKKAAKKSKDKDKCRSASCCEKSECPDAEAIDSASFKTSKKHKKKHRHKHDEPLAVESLPGENTWHDIKMEGQSNECQRIEHFSQESNTLLSSTWNDTMFDNKPMIEQPRPRLLYTWKQNQGLSRVASSPKQSSTSMSPSSYLFKSSPVLPLRVSNSPHRRKNASPARVISASPNWHVTSPQNVILKDYPLRSKSISGHSSSGLSSENLAASEHCVGQVSEDSQSHSSGVDSNISDFCDGEFGEEINSEDEFFFREQSPGLERDGNGEDDDNLKPLMMKIQTQNVNECVLEEGREVRVGDVVWGKIPGFPWWPGRVSSITVTQRDNDVVITQLAKVCWFGSNTMSHVHCADLYPFLEEFKARYNKKKKGQYRVAIKQATIAAQMLTDAREGDFSFEGYE